MNGINDMRAQRKGFHEDCSYRCGEVCYQQQTLMLQQHPWQQQLPQIGSNIMCIASESTFTGLT